MSQPTLPDMRGLLETSHWNNLSHLKLCQKNEINVGSYANQQRNGRSYLGEFDTANVCWGTWVASSC